MQLPTGETPRERDEARDRLPLGAIEREHCARRGWTEDVYKTMRARAARIVPPLDAQVAERMADARQRVRSSY